MPLVIPRLLRRVIRLLRAWPSARTEDRLRDPAHPWHPVVRHEARRLGVPPQIAQVLVAGLGWTSGGGLFLGLFVATGILLWGHTPRWGVALSSAGSVAAVATVLLYWERGQALRAARQGLPAFAPGMIGRELPDVSSRSLAWSMWLAGLTPAQWTQLTPEDWTAVLQCPWLGDPWWSVDRRELIVTHLSPARLGRSRMTLLLAGGGDREVRLALLAAVARERDPGRASAQVA